MTSYEFLAFAIGSGVFVVCAAWATKILSDVSIKIRANRRASSTTPKAEEPIDLMERRLQEFRTAQFGRPMTAPKRSETSTQTWPVVKPRVRVPQNEKNQKERGQK